MPVEALILASRRPPLERCPECGDKPFRPFLRGQVQRSPWTWKTLWLPIGKPRPYSCLICWGCKKIVGFEEP